MEEKKKEKATNGLQTKTYLSEVGEVAALLTLSYLLWEISCFEKPLLWKPAPVGMWVTVN